MSRKLSHKVFEVRQKMHIWIEGHDGHYDIMSKSDLVGGDIPHQVGSHESLIHAQAALDALIAIFTPNMIEGSMLDVSEFDHKGAQS